VGEVIDGVILTPLKVIPLDDGDVLHGMKNEDDGFNGFGEAYFSEVKQYSIKAWKRHRKMTLNLIVPIGTIKFILLKETAGSIRSQSIIISRDNYARLTIPPMVWFGFQGVESTNMLLNIADIVHDPMEVDKKALDAFDVVWS
jgi:dTDP-4-dehydrorhamnose 3,5-epimerase